MCRLRLEVPVEPAYVFVILVFEESMEAVLYWL